MQVHRRSLFLVVVALLVSGCASLPGLRVLTGQESPDAQAERVIETTGLVMADKTGTTDPSLIAAADRIEAAAGNVDIIEIRQDVSADEFSIFMLLQPPSQNETQQQRTDAIRRAVELAWVGTTRESQGSDLINISVLSPGLVPTLDHGPSFIGIVNFNIQISRENMLTYLAQRPTTLESFINLIAEGKMAVDSPQETQFYEGRPNHPVFMLSALAAQAQQQSGQ